MTLTPAFAPNVTEYTASTSNATNKITATPEDASAEVSIASDTASIADNGTATWADGENVVTITVSAGGSHTVYTITVTKS